MFDLLLPLTRSECGSERFGERSGVMFLLLHASNLDLTMVKKLPILIIVFLAKKKKNSSSDSRPYIVIDIEIVMFVMTEEDL